MAKLISISDDDDDLCSDCRHCVRNLTGDLSLSSCAIDSFDDAVKDEDGDYIEHCLDHGETRAFTVILLYPDTVAGSYGETFMETATVPYDRADPGVAVKAAVAAVRASAMGEPDDAQEPDARDPEDYAVVAVVEGDHKDIGYLA